MVPFNEPSSRSFSLSECPSVSGKTLGVPETAFSTSIEMSNGGRGVIRTRDFCLAKAAIYRADLLAHYHPNIPA
jgi:hypothetical protein